MDGEKKSIQFVIETKILPKIKLIKINGTQ